MSLKKTARGGTSVRHSSSNRVFRKKSSQGTRWGKQPKSGKEIIHIMYSLLSEEKVLQSEHLMYAPSGYVHLGLELSQKPAMWPGLFSSPPWTLEPGDICKTTVINHVTPLQNILQGPSCAFCIYGTLRAHLCVCPSYILIHAQASFLATGQMYRVHDHVHALVHKMTFPWNAGSSPHYLRSKCPPNYPSVWLPTQVLLQPPSEHTFLPWLRTIGCCVRGLCIPYLFNSIILWPYYVPYIVLTILVPLLCPLYRWENLSVRDIKSKIS